MRHPGPSARRLLGRVALGLTAAALASTGAAQAKFLPAPGSPYATGNEPYSVYPAGFNSDALTDLATVNGSSGDINVFDQQPGGTGFAVGPGSPFTVGGGPSYAAVQDFNNDGRQDVAVAQFLGQSVTIMLQQANGTLAAEGAAIPVGDQAGAIAAGDFNADNKPDFAVAGWNNHIVSVYLRKADNTGFVAGPTINEGGTNPRYMAVGDLDGANGPDIAVANIGSGNASVLLNQPGGGLALATGSPYTVGDSPQTLAIARLDGDANPDIAVANYGTDNVTILARQPGGGFQQASGSPVTVGDAPVGIAAADFRGSGRVDLAVANSASNTVTILQNDGASFSRAEDIPVAPATTPWGVATGQFNDADTLPDLAVGDIGGSGGAGDPDRLSVFINQPPPQATTLDASDVTGSTATLNATVNPRGADSDAHFEYGTSEAYGSLAPAGGELAAGADRSDHAISRAIDGLAPGTTYHFRVVASSAGGTSAGQDKTFTTSATPPPPSTLSGPPQAYLSAPAEVAVGTKTVLSAEGSTPAADLSYRLDLDGSGSFATDLGKQRSLETTFTTPGDVKVSLRVTDSIGRTDTVRRTVHVTPPPVYALSVAPSNPDPGDKVRFTLRQVIDDTTKPGGARITPLSDGSLSTIAYGDGSKLRGTAGSFLIPGRAASTDGSFTHTFDRSGSFKLHVSVDDLNGFQQGVDVLLRVGHDTDYAPAISTSTTTVEQGTCVSFKNATANRLSVDHVGPIQDEDINPVHRIIIVAPDKKFTTFGGQPKYDDQPINLTTFASSTVLAGSPKAHFQFTPTADLQLNFRRAAKRDEPVVEPTQPADPDKTCKQFADIESALAAITKPPYPPGAGAGWPDIPACPNRPRTTYDTRTVGQVTPVLRHLQTTRHTWFSINRWDFGDGTKTGASAYLPSYEVYHPYISPGNFNVKLSTTFPDDLGGQLDEWIKSCKSNPLDPTKDDKRFVTRSAELKLHVRAHFERIKSHGLWMTTAADYFEETDLPDVYSTTGAVFINTRRASGAFDPATGLFNNPDNVADANGVIMVVPDGGSLLVAPKSGEIIGKANLWWQSNGQSIQLGPMPTTVKGTPGLLIPEAGSGRTHDFGVFTDPPAVLGAGAPPPRGAAFHVNSAHVVLRENNNGGPGGGALELNVHLPPPLGPNGAGSDETIVRNVSGNGKVVAGSRDRRGLLDNVDVSIPAVELVPGIVSFDGGKLSHHVNDKPPWQATGGLTVFGKKISMSPDSKKQSCPVSGGLGFEENGTLYNAGAVLDGLEIPLPNPPAPNPITAIANPAFEILPATSDRPLDMFGCLSLHDYPAHDTFTVTGCIGFLSAGAGGVSVPKGEPIPLCPNELGGELFALTDQNSTPDPGRPGRRILRGIVVRASGGLGLGPKQFPVANAYLEYRNTGDSSTVEAKGHVGLEFDAAGGHVGIGGDVFGRFRTLTDWDIGGEGGVTQNIFCVPFTSICPAPGASLLIAYRGFGVCARAYGGIGVGGSVTFADLRIHAHVPGCDLADLRKDLGVPGKRLPRYDDLLYRPNDPLLALGAAQSTGVQMKGGSPYSVIVVNGTDSSPIVQVRDPSGKLVIDDNGQPVQGLKKAAGPPKPVDLASETPPAARAASVANQQGLIHNDLSNYHDADVDLRHATLIQIRAPKKGRYTITTKDGSSPITAISHADAFATPRVHAGVLKKGRKRMLSLQSKLPIGASMTIAEEGRNLSHRITVVKAARASSAGAGVTAARVNKRVPFHPALGDAGKRKLVAVISRDGIPQERIVVGSYRAPAVAKAGRVRKLHVKRSGSKLTITWRRAANAKRYVVSVKSGKHATTTRSVGPKAHRLVLREALARRGATVTVRAIGPLSVAGKAAHVRLKPAKVKRPKHYVL